MRRELSRDPFKLNANHAWNRFEQRVADAGGVGSSIERQRRLARYFSVIETLPHLGVARLSGHLCSVALELAPGSYG